MPVIVDYKYWKLYFNLKIDSSDACNLIMHGSLVYCGKLEV